MDPIFSTGVSIALNNARFASADILQAVEIGEFGKAGFQRFEQTLRWETSNRYKFISVYYRLNVLFTAFVRNLVSMGGAQVAARGCLR
ncbi:hypothetical protein KSF_075060 [Reticulibacter mediterranei]|uniref:Uncharacterized protein n=1 Tax=Reticulibacter mediterranei TaxID=2778369 RepID=A0A8J3INW9_9CHLR|nr:hypothetical protein [Reticulibacter mediterranei]GHO97458.1 hypothetical protein KSF_075060 [Reticulibacter mediterranei]